MPKKFIEIPCDLYMLKEEVDHMIKTGDAGIGYVSVPEDEKHKYELIRKAAFLPGYPSDIIDDNTYKVCFILL